MKFAKFLRIPYFTEHLQWLPLTVSCFQPAVLLKKRRIPYFTEHLQWLPLIVSCFQPAVLLKKRPTKMFFCEFCKIFKNIFWQNTSGWLLLVFICEFWDVFQNTSFIEHLGETAILCTSCRISTTRYSKKLFHRCFSSILYKNEK